MADSDTLNLRNGLIAGAFAMLVVTIWSVPPIISRLSGFTFGLSVFLSFGGMLLLVVSIFFGGRKLFGYQATAGIFALIFLLIQSFIAMFAINEAPISLEKRLTDELNKNYDLSSSEIQVLKASLSGEIMRLEAELDTLKREMTEITSECETCLETNCANVDESTH